tara:strand:- start:1766 stop:3073 length:1308 start_codon:yes stop_codon:yes gene_type:complete
MIFLNKKYFHFILIGFISLITVSAEAIVNLKGLSLLEKVTSSIQDGNIKFNLQFKGSPPNFKGPIFYQRSIQIEFQNTYVKPSKQTFSSPGEGISGVFVAQYDPKTVRVRFMLTEEGADLRENFHLSKSERALQIRINKSVEDALDQLISEISISNKDETKKFQSNEASTRVFQSKTDTSKIKSEDFWVKNTKNLDPTSQVYPKKDSTKDVDFYLSRQVASSNDILTKGSATTDQQKLQTELSNNKLNSPVSSLPIKSTQISFNGDQEGSLDLTTNAIKMFSALALLLGVMFIVLYVLKKYVLKNGVFGNAGELINVLGSGMLSPRKSVTLVEVAGDILVLGISQDHITLLATYQDEEKIKMIKEILSSRLITKKNKRHATNIQQSDFYQKSPKSAQNLAKYIKNFKSKPKKESTKSVRDVNTLIQKKLGALRTA